MDVNQFDSLFESLNAIFPLSADLKAALNYYLKFERYEKRQLILKEGQICNNIYFIRKGLLRAYYNSEKEEITSWFMMENDVMISVYSFYSRMPSAESIETLEETELIYTDYDSLQAIYRDFPEFNAVGRALTEKYYVLSEERLIAMRRKSAKERYDYLLEKYPEILKRVPVKYIASYLGVSRETLSRIRQRK